MITSAGDPLGVVNWKEKKRQVQGCVAGSESWLKCVGGWFHIDPSQELQKSLTKSKLTLS